MIKDIFRGVGIGCILAAGIMYFIPDDNKSSEIQQYKSQLNEAKVELDRVKKELAVAQTHSFSKQDDSINKEPKSDDTIQKEKADPITKTILTIESGSSSTTVAQKLVRAGIIKDGNELEHYLDQNKLSGRIQIGEHEVDSTMDIAQIASIITNTN